MRVASFQYLDGVWEWVQVMSDHVASHYTMLAIQYAMKPARGAPQNHVSIVALPTKCSQTIDLPSAQISSKGGATMRQKGSVHHVKVDPGPADPPSSWKDWNEYLQDKPGELTPDQLVEVLRYDLQVTINEGFMETQMELLKTISGFVDHFQSEMTTLSPPQMHALLDHLQTRCGGG